MTRVYCDVCGREIPGGHHPSVLLVNHYDLRHGPKTRQAAA